MPEEKVVEEKTERDSLYEQYEKQAEAPPAEEKTEPAPVETASPAEPEKKEEVQEKKEETKQEPHDAEKWKAATYEERMKRKAVNEALEKERIRTAALERRIREFETQKTEEPITDYDRELVTLKNKIRAIEETEQERVKREKQEAIDGAMRQTESDLNQAHKDLLAEGYPGFKYAKASVTEHLLRLVKEDPENAILDSPSGWKKIYKEHVYPEMRQEQEAAEKQRAVDEKTNLKMNANLANPGSKPSEKKKDEPKTERELFEEYLRERRGM